MIGKEWTQALPAIRGNGCTVFLSQMRQDFSYIWLHMNEGNKTVVTQGFLIGQCVVKEAGVSEDETHDVACRKELNHA